MLRDLSYKGVYKSDFDNILEDFYFPTLSIANRYDRSVGFFSASTISYAAQALSVFVKNGGQIRLILGAFSDREDLEAVKQGYREKEISEKIGSELLSMVSNVSDELFQNRFETLSWLVAHGRLEVKIALRERGMYHDKVGVVSDEAGDRVVPETGLYLQDRRTKARMHCCPRTTTSLSMCSSRGCLGIGSSSIHTLRALSVSGKMKARRRRS